MAIDSALAAAAATNFSPLLTTVGFGGLVGFLIGFVIRKLIKILAIIAGVFLATLMYLEAQGVLSTIINTVNSTASGGVGGSPAAASSLLPTTMMTNVGIPLTGSTALGFAIGTMKG